MICLLIRHADTDALHRGVTGWLPGIHLSEGGRAQAQALAGRLSGKPLRAVYASPLERARETAAAIAAPHGLGVEVWKEIIEVDCGEWAGRTFPELETVPEWKRFNTYRSSTRIPGGETMLDVQSRMVNALETLRVRHGDATIAVVSHGDPIRAAVCHYAGIPLDLSLRLEISPASVSTLGLHQWGAQVLGINATGD